MRYVNIPIFKQRLLRQSLFLSQLIRQICNGRFPGAELEKRYTNLIEVKNGSDSIKLEFTESYNSSFFFYFERNFH